MSYYNGNTSSNPVAVGDVQDPYYWWVGGGLWGIMLDYYHYTKDPSYNQVVIEALLAKVNLGPEQNYMPPEHKLEEGNDDLFFWGSAVLSAAERNFPQPNGNLPSWLQLSENVFKQLESQWDESSCGGGVFWQVRADNPNGKTYKNTISNGGFFQLAARLARATGEASYLDWADKIWDWSWNLNLIDHRNYHVYDGASIHDNCKKTNYASFTYTTGIYMYGAAVMYNVTGKQEWLDRTEGILEGSKWFFYNKGDAHNIMYEGACETNESCWDSNADMTTFKGFFSQFLWRTSIMLPSLKSKIHDLLYPSIEAAVNSCTGGESGTQCGDRWINSKFEGRTGLGPEMCALGLVQGLLAEDASAPLAAKAIQRNSNAQFKPLDTYAEPENNEKPQPKPQPKPTDDDKPTSVMPTSTHVTSSAAPVTSEEPTTSSSVVETHTDEDSSTSEPAISTLSTTTMEEPRSTSSTRTTTADADATDTSTLKRPTTEHSPTSSPPDTTDACSADEPFTTTFLIDSSPAPTDPSTLTTQYPLSSTTPLTYVEPSSPTHSNGTGMPMSANAKRLTANVFVLSMITVLVTGWL